jgi:hypothetical protein
MLPNKKPCWKEGKTDAVGKPFFRADQGERRGGKTIAGYRTKNEMQQRSVRTNFIEECEATLAWYKNKEQEEERETSLNRSLAFNI